MKQLRIGHLSTAYHTAFVVMGSDWVQKKLKLDANWQLFPTGPAMVEAFRRGSLDIGYIGLPPAMIGMDQGLAIRCVAGGHVEGTIVTALPSFRSFDELGSVEETLKQLRGKILGTPSRGSIHDVIIRKLIDDAGLEKEVIIQNFEWADFILEAMEDNKVAAGCGTPPLAVLAERFLAAPLILPPQVLWPYNPSYGLVATMELIETQPEMVKGFLQIHEDACNLMRLQPEKASKYAVKEIRIVDDAFLQKVYRVSPKYCASLPTEYMESTMAFVPVLRAMGYISQNLQEDEVFHTYFIEQVHKENQHYDDPGRLR